MPTRSRPRDSAFTKWLEGLRPPRSLLAVAVASAVLGGCSDSTAPKPLTAPPFVFVSNADGGRAIFRFDGGTITRLSGAAHDDREPHSAHGRIVFTSRRDGDEEIYIAGLDLSSQQRLTLSAGADTRPALNPSGTTVAFVSARGGVDRVWLMDADGANPRALSTGSASIVPEGHPAWSPTGDRIAFTSVRSNTSQVFVVPAAGGQAVQLSHESSGAFNPVWSADGRAVHYMAVAGGPRLVTVQVSSGAAQSFAEDERGLNELACGAAACIATVGPLDTGGDLLLFSRDGRTRAALLERAPDDRQPAILVPR